MKGRRAKRPPPLDRLDQIGVAVMGPRWKPLPHTHPIQAPRTDSANRFRLRWLALWGTRKRAMPLGPVPGKTRKGALRNAQKMFLINVRVPKTNKRGVPRKIWVQRA